MYGRTTADEHRKEEREGLLDESQKRAKEGCGWSDKGNGRTGSALAADLWRAVLTSGTWRSTRSYSREIPRTLYSGSGDNIGHRVGR